MKENPWFKKYTEVKPRIFNKPEEREDYLRRQKSASQTAEAIVQKAQVTDLNRPFANI